MWYANQGRERRQKNIVNYLHISPEQRLLLDTLVKRIDNCESNSKGGFLSFAKNDGENSRPRRSFMEDYQQNVEANMQAEMKSNKNCDDKG